MSQDEFELRFLSQDEFELRSMEGQTTRYARAQPFVPRSADLQAFAGRYASEETGSAFQMVPGKVVAFDYSNPVVRNIKFTRMSDRT